MLIILENRDQLSGSPFFSYKKLKSFAINSLEFLIVRFLRFLWFAITLAAFGAGLYQLVTLTQTYLTYPVTLETKVLLC